MSAPTPRRKRTKVSRADSDEKGDKEDSIKVIVRCRPPSKQENTANAAMVVACKGNEHITVRSHAQGKAQSKTYAFDQVFNQYATQEDIYKKAIEPIVEDVLGGFNCTVFAYGQTGTGKTYTMEGELTSDTTNKHAGVIPRSVHTIFERLTQKKTEYSVKVSFLELYNEELSDLLADEKDKKDLRIYEDVTGKKGMCVNNLQEAIVQNADQVFGLLKKSWKNRQVAATKLNKNSSRSHCVFTITVHSKEETEEGDDIIKTGKLHLVDLAGSECVGRSGAMKQRAKEAGKINQSLLTLGRVINALVDRISYVPYRDSKLTRLLQESLGGCAKTCIIATVSPAAICVDESVSTLDYANRAKNIKNKPQVNQKLTGKGYMKELMKEIAALKRENECLRLKNGIFVPPEMYEQMNSSLKSNKEAIEEFSFTLSAKEEELKTLQKLLGETKDTLQQTQEAKAAVESELKETQGVLGQTKETLVQTEHQLGETKQELVQTQGELADTQERLEEEKFIVSEQQQTEEGLTAQAGSLKGTLEQVIADKDALHDKIGRKAEVEQINAEFTGAYEKTFNEQLLAHREGLKTFITAQQGAYAGLRESVASFVTEKTGAFNALVEEVARLTTCLAERDAHIAELVDSGVEAAGDRAKQAAKQSQAFSVAQAERLKQMREQSQKDAEGITRQLEQQQLHLSQWHAGVEAALSRRSEIVSKFVGQQTEALGALNASVEKHTQESVAAIDSSKAYIAKFQAEQKQQADNALAGVLEQMQRLATAMHASQQQSIDAAVAELTTRMTAQAEAHQSQMQQVQAQVQAQCASVQEFEAEVQAEHKAESEDAKDRFNKGTQFHDATTAAVNSFAQAIAVSAAEMQTAGEGYNQGARTLSEEQQAALSTFAKQHTERLAELTNERVNSLNAHTTAVQAVADSTAKVLPEWSEALAEQSNAAGAAGQAQQAACEQMSETARKYIHEELKEDVPTGKTPAKRNFEYPSRFHATRAREELIATYRRRKNGDPEPEQDGQEQEGMEESDGSGAEQGPAKRLRMTPTKQGDEQTKNHEASADADVIENQQDKKTPSEDAMSVEAVEDGTQDQQFADANDENAQPSAAPAPSSGKKRKKPSRGGKKKATQKKQTRKRVGTRRSARNTSSSRLPVLGQSNLR